MTCVEKNAPVTYYADLSVYDYLPEEVPPSVTALTVGWLDRDHPFLTGPVPEGFVTKLTHLCVNERRGQTRGYHACHLCPKGTKYRLSESVDGQPVHLGSAEVRVREPGGKWLIAPNMVLHYVIAHEYQPPQEFIEAVMSNRVAD